MQLPTEIFGDVVVVHAPDEVNFDHAEQIAEFLLELKPNQIVLDLDDAETLDSAGLTTFLDVQDKLRENGGELKISTSNATNAKILEITRLDMQLEVFESVIDGVRSFR